MRRWKGLTLAGLALVALVALGLGSAIAGGTAPPPADDATAPEAVAAEAATVPVSFNGMIVHVDPTTGAIRPPTPLEARQLSAAIAGQLRRARLFEPREFVVAGGGMAAELDPALYDLEVARIEPDGTVIRACVKGEEQAAEFMTQVAPPAAREEE